MSLMVCVCRHELQRCTNQIAKDTGTYVKDLNRLSASQHSVEPVSKMISDGGLRLCCLGMLTAVSWQLMLMTDRKTRMSDLLTVAEFCMLYSQHHLWLHGTAVSGAAHTHSSSLDIQHICRTVILLHACCIKTHVIPQGQH